MSDLIERLRALADRIKPCVVNPVVRCGECGPCTESDPVRDALRGAAYEIKHWQYEAVRVCNERDDLKAKLAEAEAKAEDLKLVFLKQETALLRKHEEIQKALRLRKAAERLREGYDPEFDANHEDIEAVIAALEAWRD